MYIASSRASSNVAGIPPWSVLPGYSTSSLFAVALLGTSRGSKPSCRNLMELAVLLAFCSASCTESLSRNRNQCSLDTNCDFSHPYQPDDDHRDI